ncbi:MAG: class I SAM-dependent methyltransferase [Candidatus Asgardarchaeum sp.]
MPKTDPFEKYPIRYDNWFERNKLAYKSELKAIEKLLPKNGQGVEIGVGTGRFAAPLGIKIGIDPSKKMLEIAQRRGIRVINAVAENLPFNDNTFDFVLMITTICFLDDIEAAFKEAYRVLRPRGSLIIGFIDKNSKLGRQYQQRKDSNVFYKIALRNS